MSSMRVGVLLFLLVSSAAAFGAKGKACHLHLVASNENPGQVQSGSSENQRFLHFVRDLKGFGFEFHSIQPEAVKEEFVRQSAENLARFVENYEKWLKEQGREVKPYKPLERDFVFWKNRASGTDGVKNEVLPVHREALQKDKKQNKHLWGTTTGGFGGVLFNMEPLRESRDEFVNSSQQNGIARVALKEDFRTDWMYAVPLPGSEATSYSTMDFNFDFRFFTFLRVFAPEIFQVFFQDLRYMVPNGLTEEAFFKGAVISTLGSINANTGGLKFLEFWKQQFHRLILTPSDAAYLLSLIDAQKLTRSNSFLEPSFDAISRMTVVVSGAVAPEDYLIKDRPYVAPYVERNGVSSGWKMRNAPRGAPNMTGDDFLIPSGPDMH